MRFVQPHPPPRARARPWGTWSDDRTRVWIIGAFVIVVGLELLELADDFADAPLRGIVHAALIAAAAWAIDAVAGRRRRAPALAAAVALAGLTLLVLEHAAGVLAVAGRHTGWGDPVVVVTTIANLAVLVAVLVAAVMQRRSSPSPRRP